MPTQKSNMRETVGDTLSVGRTKGGEYVVSWHCDADGSPYSFPHRESVRMSRQEAEWLRDELDRQLRIKS